MIVAFDEVKLELLMQQVIKDIGATFHAPLVLIGEKLGLFKSLAHHGPMTASELANRTQTAERYVQEWLNAMAAGGYVSYDPAQMRYFLTPEQVLALADENSPAYIPGAFQAATAAIKSKHGWLTLSAPVLALGGMSMILSYFSALSGFINPST